MRLVLPRFRSSLWLVLPSPTSPDISQECFDLVVVISIGVVVVVVCFAVRGVLLVLVSIDHYRRHHPPLKLLVEIVLSLLAIYNTTGGDCCFALGCFAFVFIALRGVFLFLHHHHHHHLTPTSSPEIVLSQQASASVACFLFLGG